MSDVSRLIAAADTFESTDFVGAEEGFILSVDFVKDFPPLWMLLGYSHIIHIFICNVNYIFLYV